MYPPPPAQYFRDLLSVCFFIPYSKVWGVVSCPPTPGLGYLWKVDT